MESDKTVDLDKLTHDLHGIWMLSGGLYKGGNFKQFIEDLDIGVRVIRLDVGYNAVIVDWQKFFLGKIKYGL